MKSQSAMEYLMTYGWAILIIAIVMISMFEFGLFNPYTFAPKAPPGACEVYRSAAGINLVGQCNNELPQYAAYFKGIGSGIQASQMSFNTNTNSYTFCAWADVLQYQPSSYGDVLVAIGYANSGLVTDAIYQSGFGMGSYASGISESAGTIAYGSWNFYCASYAGRGSTSRTDYLNGQAQYVDTSGYLVSEFGYPIMGNVGYTCCGNYNLPPYYEANVQIYNTSLSQSDVQALYMEGIGGPPISVQTLIGWWPLNGNTNDYSGNDNNGAATNVSFTSGWYSGYTQP